MVTQELQERMTLVELAGAGTLDGMLLQLRLAKKPLPGRRPPELTDKERNEYKDAGTGAFTLFFLASLIGFLPAALEFPSLQLLFVWLMFSAICLPVAGVRSARGKRALALREDEIAEFDAIAESELPEISTLSLIQKRRLLISYFRDMVADVRRCTLGPKSEVMKTEVSIKEKEKEARSTLQMSGAIRQGGKLSDHQAGVLDNQIDKLERLVERFERILTAHHQGKEVITSRLRAFETALGLLDPEGAIQHIVDKTQELEWAADRLEAESTESLLRVVQHLAGYMTRLSNGLQSLSSYTFDAIDVQDEGGSEKVFVRLPDESMQELSALLEEVVPDPRELALTA